jgi:hypothetical protein
MAHWRADAVERVCPVVDLVTIETVHLCLATTTRARRRPVRGHG